MNTEASHIVELPSRDPDNRRAIGTILVEEGRLGANEVDRVHRFAQENGLLFGAAAVQLRVTSQDDVDFALARQFDFPILLRGADGVDEAVVAAHNPESPALEPLRALRSELTLRWLSTTTRRMLAIASPERGEGRSWLAANLATSFAQAGQRTLLIDADLRNPVQHRLFNLDNSAGLSALLTGRTAGKEVVRRIHPQLKLFVLPGGFMPPNPQELLLRPMFETMLDRFAQVFGVVVLDTPAAADSADAQIISARAGAAVLLSRRNHSRVSQLVSTMRGLVETGVQVLGSVVNEY